MPIGGAQAREFFHPMPAPYSAITYLECAQYSSVDICDLTVAIVPGTRMNSDAP